MVTPVRVSPIVSRVYVSITGNVERNIGVRLTERPTAQNSTTRPARPGDVGECANASVAPKRPAKSICASVVAKLPPSTNQSRASVSQQNVILVKALSGSNDLVNLNNSNPCRTKGAGYAEKTKSGSIGGAD